MGLDVPGQAIVGREDGRGGVVAQSGLRDRSSSASAHLDSATGWLVVGSTFLATFTVFGVAYSFGSFFLPMAEEFGASRSFTALVFSITTFVYFALGVVTGRISDRIGPRPVLIFGAVCLVLGLLATSQVESLWLGYFTYGLGVGIGVACAYVPMVATVGLWFERRRSAALGAAVAGIGVGTLVVVPLVEALIERQGWRATYVTMAIGSAVLLGLASVGARRPATSVGAAPRLALRQVVESRDFLLLYGSALLAALTLFLPFVFLDDYLIDRDIDGSAALLVGLIGLSSVIGRLGLGALAARFDPIRLYQLSFLVMAASPLLWLAIGSTYQGLVVFALVLGLGYGGFIALAPAVAAQLFGPVGLGGVLGALYTAAGFGGLIGPPSAGLLIDQVGYPTTLATAGAAALLGFLVLLPVNKVTSESASGSR